MLQLLQILSTNQYSTLLILPVVCSAHPLGDIIVIVLIHQLQGDLQLVCGIKAQLGEHHLLMLYQKLILILHSCGYNKLIAGFNAAKHFIECTRMLTEQGNASKLMHMICSLSQEVVEKSLKALYLAKCDSNLTNNMNYIKLVAFYDQLRTTDWALASGRH